LRAIVNGEPWVYPNGQLKALVNGQLLPLVNNFDVGGANNNARTMVVVDEEDLLQQAGDIGGMFAMPVITGLNAGYHQLLPGAFINENFTVTYGVGEVEIIRVPLIVKVDNATRVYGEENPDFTATYTGFMYNDGPDDIEGLTVFTTATRNSNVGRYPISISEAASVNYDLLFENGTLTITPAPLIIKADNKTRAFKEANPTFTVTYSGLVGSDTKESVCIPYQRPANPIVFTDFERTTTYENVRLNGQSNVFFANPGESMTLSGSWSSQYWNSPVTCPGCITQLYIGMGNGKGGNTFTQCYDVSFTGNWSGNFNIGFNAPSEPGVYYITQRMSWYFFCYQPDQGAIIHDAPIHVIGVVIVGAEGDITEIKASTLADENSPAGEYAITLKPCTRFNPNYSVTLVNGVLTIQDIGIQSIVGSNKKGNVGIVGMAQSHVVQKETAQPEWLTIAANTIYPNPAQTFIRYKLSEDVVNISGIQVIDQAGRVNTAQTKKLGDKVYETNVNSLKKGIYFLKAQTSTGVVTLKFVKL
jgi:hypothetical protein